MTASCRMLICPNRLRDTVLATPGRPQPRSNPPATVLLSNTVGADGNDRADLADYASSEFGIDPAAVRAALDGGT